MGTTVQHKIEAVNQTIRTHMAKAFFASAWADQCEESYSAAMISGSEIMDLVPSEIDSAAVGAARTLELQFLAGNPGFPSLAHALVYIRTKVQAGGDRERNEEMFGHYLAMQSMGTGVGLYDAFGRQVYEALVVPYVEFGGHSLENDYF